MGVGASAEYLCYVMLMAAGATDEMAAAEVAMEETGRGTYLAHPAKAGAATAVVAAAAAAVAAVVGAHTATSRGSPRCAMRALRVCRMCIFRSVARLDVYL